jgi:thiosulfate dehydrogenase
MVGALGVGALMVIGLALIFADLGKGTPGSSSVQVAAAANEPWVTQAITACDKKKTVIVEGYREGELMPPEKARHVAELLMTLMKYCDYEVLARLPQQGETVYLSIEGRPFVTMSEVGEELPFILVHGGTPHSAREKRVWAAEQKRIIDEGYKLFHSPKLGTNGISCDMCHPNASNIHPETYPKFQTQLKTVALLRDMVNWCIENPMEGGKLADGDHKMKALEAYMLSARAGKTLAPGKH